MSPRFVGLEEHPECSWCGEKDPIIEDHKAYPVYNYVEGFAHRPCLKTLRKYQQLVLALKAIGWSKDDFLANVELLAAELEDDEASEQQS